MGKKILGLDVGSNSLGWALLEADDNNVSRIIDLGSRIVYSKSQLQQVRVVDLMKYNRLRSI